MSNTGTAIKENPSTTSHEEKEVNGLKQENINKQSDTEIDKKSMEKEEEIHDLNASDPDIIEIIDKLPDEDQQVIKSRILRQERYSGPIPHPEHMERYSHIYPDAPEIILNLAIEQQNHRHEMEKRKMALEEKVKPKVVNHFVIGMTFGFILALIFLIGGFICIFNDKDILGIAMIITGLVGPFLLNNRTQNKTKGNDDKKPK